jgi:hypothetical protein
MRAGRPSLQTLAAIRQAAGRHGVQAQVTGLLPGEQVTQAVLVEGTPASIGFHPDPGGQEGLRYFDGQDWSPFLFPDADPASCKSDDPGTLPRVWSPLNMLTVNWQTAEPDAEPDELTADQGGQPGESYIGTFMRFCYYMLSQLFRGTVEIQTGEVDLPGSDSGLGR